VLDQWSKVWAAEALPFGTLIEVMPHFDLKLAHNYGAAFSIFADAGGWQQYGLSIFAVLVSLVLLVWLYRIAATEKLLSVALSLILSGALGNAYDRIAYGYVIDFIDWYLSKDGYHWPTFNIADVAIFIGAGLLILEGFVNPESNQKEPNKNPAASTVND
jgi:signal peptidase II